jgi:hypothetical protein
MAPFSIWTDTRLAASYKKAGFKMAGLSRKSFIEQASVGAAAAAALVAVPGYTFARQTAHASTTSTRTTAHAGPILAHVRNAATGEIAVLFGTREVIIHDREVANRLLRAAQ